MPPASSMRKTSTTTHANGMDAAPRRTTSGRAIRANASRPTNYYARPYASFSAAPAANDEYNGVHGEAARGFFPALQSFTDAITALPKEVIRQFTLMKEVEAKVYGSNETLGELVDELMKYDVPPRKNMQSGANGPQGLLSFTANNSTMGSASASLVNGVAPNATLHSARNSVAGSVINGEETAQPGSEEELTKRQKSLELRALTHSMLANLDEKNVVLAETNRVLSQQLARIDSILPHIDNEISETSRLGSMTHWAYSDNRQKKQTAGTTASRRDVAATNSLAAAASAIHETEIAQARRDAGREAAREKHKGRGKEQLDSDFDDKPRKTHAKAAKSKAAAQAGPAGLGISGASEPVKRRKVEKGLAAPAMERSASALKGTKGGKETPRSTPNMEPTKKATKAKPAPPPLKRKGLHSATASPALASSPLHSSFHAAAMDAAPEARPQSARLQRNSLTTNLRHEKLVDGDASRPASAAGKVNGEKRNGKRKASEDEQIQAEGADEAKKSTETADNLKREDTEMQEAAERPQPSRSASNSGKAGRGSNTGTPRSENFSDVPSMVRTRSTRSMRGLRDESSSEPQVQGPSRHRRHVSNSHLVKQLAPFNRSPDLDRNQPENLDEDLDGLDVRMREEPREGTEPETRSPKRKSVSRRNTVANIVPTSPARSEHGDADAVMADAEPEAEPEILDEPEEMPALEPDGADGDVEAEEDEDSEPGDPDDPNEPKYCYCNRGSYGEMVACDNEQCPREWFHIGCTELKEPPPEEEKWYCKDCRPLFRKGKGRGVRALGK